MKIDEIDLIELFKEIKGHKKIIFRFVLVSIAIGIIVIIGTPNEYKSQLKLLVETNNKSSGMSGLLQQVGGLTGLNLNNNFENSALPAELYPEVVKTTPFLIEVSQVKIKTTKGDSITVYEYLRNYSKKSLLSYLGEYSIGLPGKLLGLFTNNGTTNSNIFKIDTNANKLDKDVISILKTLKDIINVNYDDETNVIVLTVELQDCDGSAQLTNKLYDLLTKYIVQYRTQKALFDFNFIEKQRNDALKDFLVKQSVLAKYQDENQNVILISNKSMEQNLKSEYNLSFNVYNSLSQQYEQAKIKVQENTPVFKVIEPAYIPLDKCKPKISITLGLFLFLGFFISSVYISSKFVYNEFRKNTNR